METVHLEAFNIIGIAVRTSNEGGKAAEDIGALWQKFISENYMEKIPSKAGHEVYSVYTDYEGDYTQPYTTLLGCKVKTLDNIPTGMIGKAFKASNYAKFNVTGNLADNIVYHAWVTIWNETLNRKYIGDFEVYGEKAKDPANAEVEIFVGIE